MNQDRAEGLIKTLIFDGEEDYWYRDFRKEDFRTLKKSEYESFTVFDRWKKKQKTFLSKWYPRMEKIYFKYFLSDTSDNRSFKELKNEKGHLLPGYIIHAPIGFRDEFDRYLDCYSLWEHRELLLVFLTQVKRYYERNLHSYESKDYWKLHKEYREELELLKDLQTNCYDISEIKFIMNKQSPYTFENQLTIRKHFIETLKVTNTEFSIHMSRNHEIFNYDSPKGFATSTLAKNIAIPLNKFLHDLIDIESDPDRDQIDCIAEFIDFTQIPIYDMSGEIIEIIDKNGSISVPSDVKKKIRNWLN